MTKKDPAKRLASQPKEVPPSKRDLEAIEPSLTSFPDHQELSELRASLDALPTTDAKIEALARAFALAARPDLEIEHARIRGDRDFFLDLHAAVEQFQISLGPLQDNLKRLNEALQILTSKELRRQRRSAALPPNEMVAAFDKIYESLIDQIAPIAALPHNVESYLSHSASLLDMFEQTNDLSTLRNTVDSLQQLRATFMPTINDLETQLGSFPEFCQQIQSTAGYLTDTVGIQYGHAPSESYGHSVARSLRQTLRHMPLKQDVPLYRGNLFLTSYLHDIVIALQSTHSFSDTPSQFLQAPQFAEFATYLRTCADPNVYRALQSEFIFKDVRGGLLELYQALHQVYLSLKGSEILDIHRDEQGANPATYQNAIQRASLELSGDESAFKIFGDFKPDHSLEYLSRVQTAPQNGQQISPDPYSARHRMYLELFRRVDETLQNLMKGEAGNRELESFLKDTSPLIQEILRRGAQGVSLQHDIQRGNYAFVAIPGESGSLALERLAAPPVTYHDLIGESWETAKLALINLRQRTLLNHVFAHMSSQPQANPSILIAAPPGGGKSLFVDAVLADPRFLAVKVATQDILSPYIGQPERHLREVIELASLKAREFEKPAVILWDDFQTLSADKHGHLTRLEKLLENLLLGNPRYEGVAIVALSNSLNKIPAAVRQAFSERIVIRQLTESERREVIMHQLHGLPLTDRFEKQVNWTEFEEKTNDVNGAVIRKIADTMFSSLLEIIADKHGSGAVMKINELAGEHAREKPLTPEARLAIFRGEAPDAELMPEDLRRAYNQVLADRNVQDVIKRQARFYDTAENTTDDLFEDEDRE